MKLQHTVSFEQGRRQAKEELVFQHCVPKDLDQNNTQLNQQQRLYQIKKKKRVNGC